jgi:uncharacterized protein
MSPRAGGLHCAVFRGCEIVWVLILQPTPGIKTRRWSPGRLWRRLRILVWAAAGLFLIASAAGSYVAVAADHNGPRVPPQQIGSDFQNVAFTSRVDHFALSGWLFRSASRTGESVIFVHGWRGGREDVDFVALARNFLAEGYDVLMFDMRGSGASGGLTQTFANDEPRDLLGAYDFMLARGYNPAKMVILGNSMGAATVIETAPMLSKVGALICDSSYTSVTSAAENGLTAETGLPGFLAAPALAFSRLWGVDPGLRPIDVVASLPKRAFLFIQSTGDNLVDPRSAGELRAASADPHSELLLIAGHSHLDTYHHNSKLFMQTVNAFIATQIH